MTAAATARIWPASSMASPMPQAAFVRGLGGVAGLDADEDAGVVGTPLKVLELDAEAGAVAALLRQLGFDRFALGFGFGAGELVEEAVDAGLRVLQQLAGGDGRGGDVVGRLVARAHLVDA